MKRKLLVIAILVLSLLVQGCQDDTSPTNTQESTGRNLPPATLTFYFPQLTSGEKPDTKLVLSEIEDKSANMLNVKLDFKWLPPSTYANTILEKISSGTDLDAFYCGLAGQGLLDFPALAREDLLADLTEGLSTFAPGLLAQYEPDELKCATFEGRLVAIPSLFPMADHVYAIVRQDFMDRYGLPAIKTFDDYGEYMAVVKQNETDIIPGKIADSTVALFARASGYAIFDKDISLVYGWNDETIQIIPWEQTAEFKQVANYLLTWAGNDYLSLETQGIGNIWDAGDMIVTGQISSFLFAGEYRIGETIGIVEYSLNNYLASNQITGEIVAYRLYPDLMAQRLNPIGDGLITGSMALSAQSANVDRTLMFLDWLQSSQANYDLIMYGIEGKHYLLDGEQIKFPDGVMLDQNGYLGWDGRPAFKNLAYERFIVGLPADAKESYAENIRNHTVLAPHESFYINDAQISELKNQRRQMLIATLELPLLSGVLDFDDIDGLIDSLSQAGTNEIIADIQTQLASYRNP